jgi:hypothetical protein
MTVPLRRSDAAVIAVRVTDERMTSDRVTVSNAARSNGVRASDARADRTKYGEITHSSKNLQSRS